MSSVQVKDQKLSPALAAHTDTRPIDLPEPELTMGQWVMGHMG